MSLLDRSSAFLLACAVFWFAAERRSRARHLSLPRWPICACFRWLWPSSRTRAIVPTMTELPTTYQLNLHCVFWFVQHCIFSIIRQGAHTPVASLFLPLRLVASVPAWRNRWRFLQVGTTPFKQFYFLFGYTKDQKKQHQNGSRS